MITVEIYERDFVAAAAAAAVICHPPKIAKKKCPPRPKKHETEAIFRFTGSPTGASHPGAPTRKTEDPIGVAAESRGPARRRTLGRGAWGLKFQNSNRVQTRRDTARPHTPRIMRDPIYFNAAVGLGGGPTPTPSTSSSSDGEQQHPLALVVALALFYILSIHIYPSVHTWPRWSCYYYLLVDLWGITPVVQLPFHRF